MWSAEMQLVLVSSRIEDVYEAHLIRIVQKEDPIHAMHDAVERRVVSVIVLPDARLARDEAAEAVEVLDEYICTRLTEAFFDVADYSVRVFHEARGVYDAAHNPYARRFEARRRNSSASAFLPVNIRPRRMSASPRSIALRPAAPRT